MKKVLVTGAAGYIGSVLTYQLLAKGYKVVGFDILNFGGESLLSVYNHPNFEFVKGDIRNKSEIEPVLNEVDAVVHLAAIVGDPACAKEPEIAEETNWIASKMIFDLCDKNDNIEQFIFASTCSNYGKMEGEGYVTEESPLNPVSLYAELKVKFENYILNSDTRKGFTTTALRFATVYGVSPRIRFDLTVNEFVRDLTFGKELVIFGEQFWRPYCHVEDLARGCITILEADKEKVNKNVFGVGDTKENYQKKMLADLMEKTIPNTKIKYVHKDEDPRDYRVDFSKIKNELGFEITKTVPESIRNLYSLLKNNMIIDPYDKKYQNI
jgi:nucleoside-diphosphate-sugar epimerase